MKTKSKRFLNLATLCLALLGTALLMEQSAEAEVILIPRPDWTSRGSGSQAKSQAKSQAEDDPHQRGRVDGHKAGLEAAKTGGNPTISPDAVPKLYGTNEEKNRSYRLGYTDMYRHGYFEGQHALEGNAGRENAGRENAGRENAGRENAGRENEEATTDDSSVEESGSSSIIDEVIEVIYEAVSTIWSYLRGWF
ncbi:hypothetical protein [Streptococcus pyogenes]|uniref:hypothetical protein n=1 Tax=Streptococcus pyogenes TaxID=1314 RepID=UPI00109C20F0|nr:hypothetical protein [Streptococcus pyogenes]VHF67548.1 Uncharacterised protein [Streptococcus pyogenes]VHG22288.1 Uncharacterised protein [Streptococcus pyogenes]HER6426927.1 hypothetical protein [Streptococcus pyogenes]HER6435019.1 hypothetical protein [Streptococcus pyogenes]HER6439960.1 hypothetical protein [Streptococcus pyogenes]